MIAEGTPCICRRSSMEKSAARFAKITTNKTSDLCLCGRFPSWNEVCSTGRIYLLDSMAEYIFTVQNKYYPVLSVYTCITKLF